MSAPIPFSAFPAGPARTALLCCAVDPALTGAVLRGPPGAGKASLIRAFLDWSGNLGPARAAVRVPLSVDRDRLLGGVDLERTLLEGRRVEAPGLLRSARGGWILAGDLLAVDPWTSALLRQWLEGEGAGTGVLGSAGRADRLPPLADLVAFHVALRPAGSAGERHEVLARNLDSGRDSAASAASWRAADASLAAAAERARRRLPGILLDGLPFAELAEVSGRLGVEGSRAEVFAARAAAAHAALRAAETVGAEDVDFAVETVLAPRARRMPGPAGAALETRDARAGDGRRPPVPAEEGADVQDAAARVAAAGGLGAAEAPAGARSGAPAPPPSEAAAAAGTVPLRELLAGRSGGGAPGRSLSAPSSSRGHAVRSRLSWKRGSHLALAATLRRAAVRQAGSLPEGGSGPRLRVRREDLCRRVFRERTGALFILAVDASGSMASHRLRDAKNLALGLLRDAYLNRDRVALIAFRNAGARVVLPPTSAMARVRREVEVLAAGGGTPLAAALGSIASLARNERRRKDCAVSVVLFTDGRANVAAESGNRASRGMGVLKELEAVAAAYRSSGLPTLVVDSAPAWHSNGDCRRLAGLIGASHVRAPG